MTVTTGTEVVTGTFTVTAGAFTVTLTNVTPSTTSPNSVVQLTASGFSGAVNPATVTVTLTPTAGSPVGPIAASTAQASGTGELVVTFLVPAATPPAVYQPSITGQNTVGSSFTSTNPSSRTLTVVAASLASIVPATAQREQTLQVTLNGTFTHFVQGSTVANFGAGISVNGGPEGGSGVLTVQTATTAVATLVISATAPLGAHTVTLTTGSEVVTGTFTVTDVPAKSITVAPSQGQQGQSLALTITGTNTTFSASSAVTFNPGGIGVQSVVFNSPTSLTVNISIPNNATLGARDVTVTTGTEVVTGAGAFAVVAGSKTISVNPQTGAQGQTLNVTITGVNTNFTAGSVVALAPNGITVNSVTFNSATSITANISIAAGAALGARNVTVTTGSEVVIGAGVFSVVGAPAKSIIVSPTSGQQGQTLTLSITGTNTNFSASSVVSFNPGGITVNSILFSSLTSLSVNITIPNNAALGARDITVTTGAEVVTATGAFVVTAGSKSISVNPASGTQGQTLSVTITGVNTNFTTGSQVAFTSDGITVNSLTFNSPTSVTVNISITAGATLGVRDVTVTTGTEVVAAAGAFTVAAAPPRSFSIAPSQGQQGQTLSLTITGTNTTFTAASTVAFSPGGITINSVTFNSPTSLSLNVTIPNNAVLGARDVTVTSGTEVVTATGAFAVVPGSKSISLTPATGAQGQTLNIAITGVNTIFTAGSQVTFNPAAGITVNAVTFNSGTSLSVNVTISASAAAGARELAVISGSEVVTAAFSITTSGPQLVSINPNIFRQGETASATITGANTSFTAGDVTVSLGEGVTVQSVTVNNTTTLTVQLSVSSTATLGTRTLTVVSAGQTLTLANAATITAPTSARLLSVSPNTGLRTQTLTVTITGENTSFVQGTTQVSMGPGITVNSINVTSATVLTAQITIAEAADIGPRTVTVTTGPQIVALANAFFVSTGGSAGPFTCLANAGVPSIVRAEGLTELIGDIVIVCTGGTAGESHLANIQLFLNTNITSRLTGASGETEALLIVDELGLLPGQAGAVPAVYRGQRTAVENAVVWPGVTVIAPGVGQRILRITNIRANAALLGASSTLIPNQITAFLSASPSQAMPLNNPQQTVAYVQRGLTFDVRNCASTQTLTNVDLAQCVGVNNAGTRDLLTGTTGDMQFSVRFQEGFQTAFKPQIQAGQIPSTPGTVYNSESGFVRATSELPFSVGGADHGTRLVARFRNVPPGVRLFVTTGPSTGSSTGLTALLVQTGPNGEGGAIAQSTTPFAVPSTGTLNCPAAAVTGAPAAEIQVVNGTAIAVWEITAANPALLESAVFGVAVAYTPDVQNRIPAAGQVTAAGSFGPFYSSEAAGRASAGPIPRFSDQPTIVNAFSIEPCVTHLLFPFVTNQQGFDTGIAISNTSRDAFGNLTERLQSGVCTINYFGQTANGGAAPSPQRTNAPVAAGGTLTFVVSSGGNYGITGTPGFQGYIFAQCDFQYAHGFAFITDGPVGSARVAEGYLGLIVNNGRVNRGTAAESLAQ